MSGMDITEFLTACVKDDENHALQAAEEFGPDWIEIWSGQLDLAANKSDRTLPPPRHWDSHVQTGDARVSRFMEHFDPARVLREVAATRKLIELHAPEDVEYVDGDGQSRNSLECTTCDNGGTSNTWPCDTAKLLAAPYADRPGYQEGWKV